MKLSPFPGRIKILVCVVAAVSAAMSVPLFAAYGQDKSVPSPTPQDEALQPVPEIPASVDDFLTNYCLDCHSGEAADADLPLDKVFDGNSFQTHRESWEKVQRMLRSREMPPEDMEQPLEEERLELMTWIKDRLDEIDCRGAPFPGRVTIRRLNRAEYNNTIRDLTGVDFQPADSFPSDDVGHGFDNIGDVLAMPPLLVEKYLEAAEQVVTKVFADDVLRDKVIFCRPGNDSERLECATKVLRRFASRAYRRPVTDEEIMRIIAVGTHAYESGANYDQALQYAMQAILVSPYFLFKVETDPALDDPDGIRELNDYEVAVRLSYFLWSSLPDDELTDLASRGELSKPDVLIQQTRRMLRDPKSQALVDNFAGQWLQLRRLEDVQPDPKMFPSFNAALRESMRRETEMFFRTVIDENRSVLDFLTADFTFVDEQLAEHYGLAVNVLSAASEGNQLASEMRRVQLPANRRGVLTHGSILLITSNPTRTSPVKRGKWILENFLGEPPPPPPQGVQELEEQPQLLGSLRERMEQHRANEACAVCHRTMDTLGFGLENFDVVGAWRDQDGRHPIDPSGSLPGGIQFQGAGELMSILADTKQEDFCRCLTEKMLTYALGRGLQNYDRCTVDSILNQMAQNEYRFTTLIEGIVLSEPFLKRASTRERP